MPQDPKPFFDPFAPTATSMAQPQAPVRMSRSLTAILEPGTMVGSYKIESMLGSGGMGEVYAALDPTGKKVAIKLLHSHLAALHARLKRESEAIAKLRHPNVVATYEIGTFRDRPFIAMEFIQGQDLRTWLDKPRSTHAILTTLVQAARGLAAAHARFILHRDFKPDNVMVRVDGTVVVTDFGLASPANDDDPVDSTRSTVDFAETQTGAFVGTPSYMSAEQYFADIVDARSDQYSFCVTLYEALHGQRPFGGATIDEMRVNVTGGQLPPPSPRDVPPRVQAAVARGLRPDAAHRFPAMEALIAEIVPGGRRRRALWIAAPLVVMAAAGGVLAWRLGVGHHDSALSLGPARLIAAQDPASETFALLPDNRLAHAAGGQLAVSRLSGEDRSVIATPAGLPVVDVVPSGAPGDLVAKLLVPSGRCEFWEISTGGRPAQRVAPDQDCATSLVIAPDGQTLAVAHDRKVEIRTIGAGAKWTSPELAGAISLAWSPQGGRLAITSDTGLVVIDGTGKQLAHAPAALASTWLDGNRLVTATPVGSKSQLRVIDVEPAGDAPGGEIDGAVARIQWNGRGLLAQHPSGAGWVYVPVE